MRMYTVYDAKARNYSPIYMSVNEEVGIRSFENAINEKGHPFNKNPEDYTLFFVGMFDPDTAALSPEKTPVISAMELKYER